VIAIGLDGFRNGWVAVTIDGDRRSIAFPRDISWLATRRFDRAAIDIPIGMTDDGNRDCDRLARERLRPHGSRVFSGSRRWLWHDFDDPDAANREAERRQQTKVSRQLWHLGPKIMQVDGVVQRHGRHRGRDGLDIRETHPELVFLRLNGGAPLDSKHTATGLAQRAQLLSETGFDELHTWLTMTRIGEGAKADDVLDACAAALAARDLAGCVPADDAPCDSHGLPMQIWF
jgi:predicted RNase H-like nuclease